LLEQHVLRSSCSLTKDICKLTDKAIKEHVPEEKVAANPEEALQLYWNHLEMMLGSSSNKKVLEAAEAIWELLKDGKAHNMDDVVAVTTYAMERSTGFGEVLKALKQLGFTNKTNNQLQFTDKVFPFGRP